MSAATPSAPQGLFSTGRLCVFAAAAAVGVAGTHLLPITQLVLWPALVAISVAIWHGAFDGVLAEEAFQPRLGSRWRPLFYAGYLALGAAVLVLWRYAPASALLAFLLYSALHFGTESDRQLSPARVVTGMATGFLPIAAACHWWPQQVATIFRLMLRGSADAAAPMTSIAGEALWPVIAVILLSAVFAKDLQRLPLLALVAIQLVLFRGCSPIVAFALFFCVWHTPEHLLSTSVDGVGVFRRALLIEHLRRGAIPWLISLSAVAMACWFGRHAVDSYLGLVFIALSALTVPHMVLAELCRRQHHPAPKPRKPFLMPRRAALR